MVRIIIKNNKFDKAHMPNWSSEQSKVLGIDKHNFLLNHPTKQTVFLRHEIINGFILKETMYKYINIIKTNKTEMVYKNGKTYTKY